MSNGRQPAGTTQVVSNAWLDARLLAHEETRRELATVTEESKLRLRLHLSAERQLCEVTSERDFLVERFRELAEEMQVISDQAEPRSASVGGAARMAAWAAAAAKVRQVVTEATTGRNVTATEGEQDGP